MDDYDDSLRQWIPGDEVVTHRGEPLPADADFFADPPGEIGEVRSAWSTLRDGREPWGLGMRLLLMGVVGLLAMIVLVVVIQFFWRGELILAMSVAGLGGLVAGGAMLLATQFKHSCTYVGTEGIARLDCVGERSDVRTRVLFLFEDATELRTSQTINYVNGIYTGTRYEFRWQNDERGTVQKLTGTYQAKEGLPNEKDLYCFAHSAEIWWSEYTLDRAQEELEREGAITFRLSGKDHLKIGPGFLELTQGGKTDRLEAGDIETVALGEGVFTVKRVGAKSGFLGIGKSGIFTFDYGAMANARVFLLALDRLMGLSFTQ